ncbi:MAG: hypothetical protein L6R40_002598 [Gallowayella cf. fulva]|nr:MAG: hypothetical protein L6R40_002598 [Xanthomendoza cf. fulva]
MSTIRRNTLLFFSFLLLTTAFAATSIDWTEIPLTLSCIEIDGKPRPCDCKCEAEYKNVIAEDGYSRICVISMSGLINGWQPRLNYGPVGWAEPKAGECVVERPDYNPDPPDPTSAPTPEEEKLQHYLTMMALCENEEAMKELGEKDEKMAKDLKVLCDKTPEEKKALGDHYGLLAVCGDEEAMKKMGEKDEKTAKDMKALCEKFAAH